MTMVISLPGLASGVTYTLHTGGTVSGGTEFHGYYTNGATVTGTTTQVKSFTLGTAAVASAQQQVHACRRPVDGGPLEREVDRARRLAGDHAERRGHERSIVGDRQRHQLRRITHERERPLRDPAGIVDADPPSVCALPLPHHVNRFDTCQPLWVILDLRSTEFERLLDIVMTCPASEPHQ